MRIAQYLAKCGIGSRRDCEKLIEDQLIKVNGSTITECYIQISDEDIVSYNNKPVRLSGTRMFLYHKNTHSIVSTKDERFSVFDDLQDIDCRLVSVGRLDFLSEGLMIITNDGMLARSWEIADVVRIYSVITYAKTLYNIWDRPLTINGILYKSIQLVRSIELEPDLWKLDIQLKEGKNREIRKIWEHYDWKIQKLIRIQYGHFNISQLAGKKYIEIKPCYPDGTSSF